MVNDVIKDVAEDEAEDEAEVAAVAQDEERARRWTATSRRTTRTQMLFV
ncbi:MAG: hypothetical protein Aurels2KO_58080 [Aureliella sp.]